MLCFAALGAGNGALFQLVPLRWPMTTAVAGSMIGEIGALGGGFMPNAMGQSKQYTGTLPLGLRRLRACWRWRCSSMLRLVQIRWTRTWAEKGGRARAGARAAAPVDYGGAAARAAPPGTSAARGRRGRQRGRNSSQ